MTHGDEWSDSSRIRNNLPEQREENPRYGGQSNAPVSDPNRAGLEGRWHVPAQADGQAPQVDRPEQPTLPFDDANLQYLRYERSGPIPSSAELGSYDQVVPGLAKRIVDEAMANMQSDRKIMENAVDTNTKLDKRGQLIAGLLCFTCVILAALCLFLIPNAAIAVPGAGIFGLAAIAPVVNSFLERGGTGGKNNSGDEKDQ